MTIPERRNDIGIKIGYFVLTAVISGMLTIFFWKTYSKAEESYSVSNKNALAIAVNQECIRSIRDNLVTMNRKLDVLINEKRR